MSGDSEVGNSTFEMDGGSLTAKNDGMFYTTNTESTFILNDVDITYADDNDPLDVLVLCSEAITPLTLVHVYPIGVIRMMDNGKLDEKIIAIPFSDPTYNGYRSIFALPRHVYEEMQHFFSVYKTLEHKETVVNNVGDERDAVKIIAAAIDNYNRTYGEKNKVVQL